MTPANSLADQVAVVTGAASGIGRQTVLALARAGALPVPVDLDPGGLESIVVDLEAEGVVGHQDATPGLAVDVRVEEQVEGMSRQVLEQFGRIDILVHCAAILRGRGSAPKPLARVSVEEWDQVMDTNLKGTFLCNRAVLPAMIKRRRGQIVNLSSTSGRKGRALDAVYCASKFGVVGLTESLAEEVRRFGVKAYVVFPDAVDTALWEQNRPIPKPTVSLAPERVADLIIYLLGLPEDTILDNIGIAAFENRRRRAASGGVAGEREDAP